MEAIRINREVEDKRINDRREWIVGKIRKNPDSDYRKHVEEIDKCACLSAGVCV